MAISMAFNSTNFIYNSRNFIKSLLLRNPSYTLLSSAASIPSPNSVLDFGHNPLRFSNLRTFSSYRSSSSSKSSIGAKNFCAIATDPLKGEAKMTVTAEPFIKDGAFMVNGSAVVLTRVPSNVVVYPLNDGSSSSSPSSAAFIGASSTVPSCRHVFGLGVLQECKFTCLFRHKIWWMIPRFGGFGSDIPIETQMLLLEVKEESLDNTLYVLLLPVLEGAFRATLQGTSANELELCVESGDVNTQTSQVSEAVFVNSGNNPFELITDSIKILERHKGTFAHINHKKKPAHLDWFGWCTWDAFYKDVNVQGIKEGLESFLEGGCPPKFLIIDDGWQDTFNEFQKEGKPSIEGSQFASRLVDLKECSKFMESAVDDTPCNDLHDFVKFIKEKYGMKYVYVWHALAGYWGGLSPSSEKLNEYNPKIEYPVQSPGNIGNYRDIAMDSLEKYGVGLIDPKKIYEFYNDLHSYLSRCGIDGVKVDVQNLIETLGTGYGGRVSLTGKYQEALEDSVDRNFKENNLISCMSHNTDSIYSSRRSASARASEDFMPWEPMFQTLHVASVAFNSLLLGEIVVPDWDMFQSHHHTAEFHGAARAVGGCAVYVSDKPGMHNFEILKKLVLHDGSILRAKYAGRPTRDCLFVDTVMDGKSLLKIWNLNNYSGIIGIFNCQGAGIWSMRSGPEKNPNSSSLVLSGCVSSQDIDFLREVADESWTGNCAVYAFHTGSVSRLSKEESFQVSIATLECEIFTVSPIRVVNESVEFAPIGLIEMYNSGGAIEGLSFTTEPSGCNIRVKARGCGRFGAYSSKKPIYCTVDEERQAFTYDSDNGFLVIKLEGECKNWDINICY
ncbi:hypothetical protein ACP275_09G013200 [Erythranthe tilingii]